MSIKNADWRSFYPDNNKCCQSGNNTESLVLAADKTSLVTFLRSFILVVSIIGFPLLAIFWDKIPYFKKQVETLVCLNNEQEILSDNIENINEIENIIEPTHSSIALASATKTEYSANQIPVEFDSDSSQTVPAEFILNDSSDYSDSLSNFDDRSAFNLINKYNAQPEVLNSTPTNNVHFSSNENYDNQFNEINISSQTNIDEWEQKLQNLGAIHFKKERWGQNGTFWRLSCQVLPFQSRGEYTQFFEVIEKDYSKALMNIVQKIECWQQNR